MSSGVWQRWDPQCVCLWASVDVAAGSLGHLAIKCKYPSMLTPTPLQAWWWGYCPHSSCSPHPATHAPTGSGAAAPAAAHAIPCCLALPPLSVWCHPQCPWPHWHPPALAAPSQGGNSCCAQVAPWGACMVGLCPPTVLSVCPRAGWLPVAAGVPAALVATMGHVARVAAPVCPMHPLLCLLFAAMPCVAQKGQMAACGCTRGSATPGSAGHHGAATNNGHLFCKYASSAFSSAFSSASISW